MDMLCFACDAEYATFITTQRLIIGQIIKHDLFQQNLTNFSKPYGVCNSPSAVRNLQKKDHDVVVCNNNIRHALTAHSF